MTMTPANAAPRRIVVLWWPDPALAPAGPDPLLLAAAALATREQTSLDVVALTAAATQGPALPATATGWQVSHAALAEAPTAEALLALFAQALPQSGLLHGPALVLLPAGPVGEALAARLAHRLGGVSLGRCSEVGFDGPAVRGLRAGFGGRAQLHLRSEGSCCLATWRPAALPDTAPSVSTPQHLLALDTVLPAALPRQVHESADAMPALEGARVVVSGGRGMQGEEGFALLAQLARRLGAALGGSLPTVDAGWVPVTRQIGQSGKFVSPRLYLAVGLSGTPQHLAGVSPDSRIVAVNHDPEAAIFGVAEVGVVADWQALLPALLHALEALEAHAP